VTVTARPAGDDVELVVADDGPGIPPVEAAVVDAMEETTVEHGNGLGLWLVNWIVTRYGGSFQLRPAGPSDAATGTVATISLPGLDPADDPAAVVRPHTTLFQ
jgi:signal transduction histidine kinase